MKLRIILSVLALGVATQMMAQTANFVAISPSDDMKTIVEKAANIVPTERQFEWQRQELTAFLHFGVNTYTNREWGDGTESEAIFNPEKLDAEQWVKALKDGGFKCAILTCKHHDGFCLWPSAYTEHCVKNSPWKNGQGDVVRAVSDACHKYGLSFGVYLSPWDMNSPLYGTEEYNEYFCNQLRELLTNYGEVNEVWFDGACGEGPNGKKQVYDFVRWYKLIRDLQPKAVIAVMGPDVRWVGTETGRGRETEWSVVPNNNLDQQAIADNSQKEMITKPVGDMTGQDLGSREKIKNAKGLVWYPAEVDVSIRPGWFYHKTEDANVKTAKNLMDIYFTSVGMNGVLLLNIPPNTDGLLADADVRNLKAFRALHDWIFMSNLLKGAKGKGAKKVVDGNYNTSYTQKATDEPMVLIFKQDKTVKANVLALQEDIRKGQRVESFVFEYKDQNGNWQKATEGTTIGYKRLIRFPEVSAKEFRLTITQSRLNPYIAEVGLYKE